MVTLIKFLNKNPKRCTVSCSDLLVAGHRGRWPRKAHSLKRNVKVQTYGHRDVYLFMYIHIYYICRHIYMYIYIYAYIMQNKA